MADRGVRRRGRGFGARGGFKRQQQTHGEPVDDFEGPEIRQLRDKHGESVSLVQAVFPEWDEVSVLYALGEASGSVELAISRIVEGQAEQWGSVKPKKQQQKREAPTTETSAEGQPSLASASTRGSFGGRGRGRGEFRGGRGGFRGAARGGRGGAIAGRQPLNGEATVTEVTDISASVDGTVTATTVTEVSGDGVAEIAVQETSTDAAGTTVQVQESVAIVEKPEQPAKSTNGWSQKGKAPAPAQAAPAAASKQAAQPGAKLSWAQIARPPPPKAQPAPPAPAPAQQVPAPVEPVVVIAEVVAEEPEPVIVVAEVQAPEPDTTETATQDPWSATPAAAVLAEAQKLSEPEALPVGEGWADSIIAKNDYAQSQQISVEQQVAQEEQHLRAQEAAPPAGVNPAGTLDVHTPAASELSPHQSSQAERLAAPPGLSKRASAIRGKQDAPVVMPGSTPDIERIGVQFGSLNLFGSIPTGSAADEQPQQQQTQQALYETPAALQQQEEYQQSEPVLEEPVQQVPVPYDIQQQAPAQYYQSQAQKQVPQYGGVFDRLAGHQQQQQHYQQPQQQHAPSSAYSSRYQPFGQPAPQQHAQDPFASITSPYLQTAARTGSAQSGVPSLAGADAISPYYSSQQAQNLQTHQATQTQQPATSPAQNARESAGSAPPQQSAYGGFTSAVGQPAQAQQPQQQQQGYPTDYSGYYGMQDQSRNLQSYYGQSEQPAQQQQYRPSATDDLTAKLGASSSTASATLGAQPQQQQLGQQQQHYNPNMMGGYNYPYYPYGGYGNPSYGNPNYPAYPAHQAPYNYGAYGQNRSAYQGGAGANHSHQNSAAAAGNAYGRSSGLGGYGNNASAGLSGNAGAPHASGYGSNAYGSFETSSRGMSQGSNAQSGIQGLGQTQQDRAAPSNDAFNDPRYSSNY